MKFFFLTMVCLSWCLTARAQSGRLKGTLLDETKHAVSGATVKLFKTGDSTSTVTTVTSGSGDFTFNDISYGDYNLNVHHVGFVGLDMFKVNIRKEELQLPPITLRTNIKSLKEVVIQSKKPMIEVHGGKLILNIEQSPAAAGSNAFDLLRRAPGVNVDPDENLLLKGSGNVNVLIDGKMTYLSAQQLTNMLKGMNADNISRIEITNTPSAQYDAAGNAGIINIVTRKFNKPGYALNIGSGISVGRYVVPSSTVTGNIKTEKLNFFVNLGYSPYHTFTARSNINSTTINGITTTYDREFGQPIKSQYFTYRAGLDYNLTRNQKIGLAYSGSSDNWSKDAGGSTYLKTTSGNITGVVQNQSVAVEPYRNNAYNANYKFSIDTSGKAVTADADYVSYSNQSDGYLANQAFNNSGATTGPYEQLKFHQPVKITIRSVKADLDLPYKLLRFKAGLKYARVSSNNNFRYDSLLNNNYVFAPSLSDHFVYDERISAAYASASRQWKNTGIDIGLRAEHTYSRGDALTINSVTESNYTDLFPSVSLDQKFGTDHALNFSLSRRINRPNYSILNPVRFFADKYSYFSGSPGLQPEKAWAGSLTYTFQNKYIATLTYSRLNNFIGQIISVDPSTGILITQNGNFPHKDRYEGLLVIPFSVTPLWDITTTANLSYTTYPVSQLTGFMAAKRFNVNIILDQTYRFFKDYLFELSGVYTSGELNGIFLTQYYYQIDGGLKKSFLNKKLDVRFAFTDLLHSNRFAGSSITNAVNYSYRYIPSSNKFSLSVVYHIGGKLVPGKIHRAEEQNRL